MIPELRKAHSAKAEALLLRVETMGLLPSLRFGAENWDSLSSKEKNEREKQIEDLLNRAGAIEQAAGIWSEK